MTGIAHPCWSDGTPILIGQTGTFSGIDSEFGQPWAHDSVTVHGVWFTDAGIGWSGIRFEAFIIGITSDGEDVFELPFMAVPDRPELGDEAVRDV